MNAPLLPPSLAERYRAARLLGEGAFGTVVYGEDREAGGRPVAIKLLKAMEDPDGSWWARFQREAKLTESLDSHYVVRSHGHGVVDEQPYLILEYVEGPTLEDYRLERGGRLPVEEALRLFVEVLFGLRAAHGQGVLHRDLKPENVLLRHGEEAVLTDFGLARDVASETLTRTGTVMGTLLYMAPEMLAGEPATARSDVYAAVCLFGELVMGRVPLGGDNIGEIYDRRVEGGFLGFRTEGVPLPPQVDRLLSQALSEDPAKRPVSAWEMSETLVDALERERMEGLLAKMTLEGVTGTASRSPKPVVVGAGEVDLDAATQEDLAPPPTDAAPAATLDSQMNMRLSDVRQPAAPEPDQAEPQSGGGVGAWQLAAAFVVLLGVSFGLGGGSAGLAGLAGAEVALDPAAVRHAEAEFALGNYLARLEKRTDPEKPTVLEAFTEMPPDIQQDQAEDRRYLAELRLKDGLPEVVAEVSGLDMGRADAELLARVARLRSWELLVHVTGEVAVRGVSPESLWGQQLGRVVARWPLPPRKKSGEVSREGGRTWRRLWRDSEARRRLVERWAADGVMRGWEHSHERFEIRGQTLEGREFLYAGDDIRPMVDVFVPDRTRWVDYWPYYEVPVEEPAPGEDLVLAIDFDRVSWSFVPHLVLVGRDAQVRLPVRPAYSEEGATDQRLRGFERFPTAVRVARHVLPEGLRAVRVINVAVESMSNVSNNFVVYELFRLEAGPLPPEAAFAAPPTEEVP